MLKELQTQFISAIFSSEQELSGFASSNAQARIKIYKTTIYENLRNCLMIIFPGVWELLGAECANSLSYAFIRSQNSLPTTGCLDDWGHDFPAFLGKCPELAGLPYIQDYAQFELLQHQCYNHSGCYLFDSKFPIQQIHAIATDPNAPGFDLKPTQVYAIIFKHSTHVQIDWISQELWSFLKNLQQVSECA